MAINISFGGASIERPGSYSTVDTAGMFPTTLGSFNVLAFIGVPGTGHTLTGVAYFNDPKLAAEAIKDSELLDTMRIAWQHGADLIAVSPVLTAGSAPTDEEWQAAIDALDTEFVDGIVPVTTEEAIYVKVDTHTTLASSVLNKRYRRAFYGHAAGMEASEVADLQATLNTERGVLASPGVYVFDNTGAKVLKGAHYLAAAYAGIWASQAPQVPITYKYVKFPGLEKVYGSTEIRTLLKGHIAPVEYVKNKGYRIVHGQTLSADADLSKSELSVSTLKDVMSMNLENYFEEKYVGQAAVEGIQVTIYNDLVSLIEKFKDAGYISGYVPESVVVKQVGTAFTLDWEGKATLPINNFLITSHFTL